MHGLSAAYAAAFTLGAAHALEVDHMVAVTAIVGGRPRVGRAVAIGLRWGAGHAATVLVLGGALAASGIAVPEPLAAWAELVVGAAMIAIGAWALRAAARLHLHRPASHSGDVSAGQVHAHLHAHDPAAHPHDHSGTNAGGRHRHLPSAMGALHGLAGAAPVAVLVPVTLLGGLPVAVGYLAAFGIGTMLAMGLFAGAAAMAIGNVARTVRAARTAGYVTATASVVVGAVWIARALAGA